MGFVLAYLHLTLTYSKGQVKIMHILDSEYFGNGDRYGKNYSCHQIASHIYGHSILHSILTFHCHVYI